MKATNLLFVFVFAAAIAALGGLYSAPRASAEGELIYHSAYLCNDCGFGNKKDNCCKCGKWRGSTSIPARLCNDCGFGNKKDNCCKCGKWCGSVKIPAYLCNDCGFGNKKDNCCKCGKWAP